MNCTAKMCLKAIEKKDEEEFELTLLKIKHFMNEVRGFPDREIKWIQDIPVFCTLYNNPRFLEQICLQLKSAGSFKPSASLGHEVSVEDIADALDFMKCKEYLIKFYGTSIDRKIATPRTKDFSIFAAILNISKLYNMNQSVVIECFHRLVNNGLDIHTRGPGNRTILHEAILKTCNFKVFETLFSLGCDVNSIADDGVSPFLVLIWNAFKYKARSQELARILTLFLYQNPTTSLNTMIFQQAMHYDRMRFPDEDEVSDDEAAEDTDCAGTNRRVHPNEHLRLFPRLYKYGFHLTQQDRDLIESPNLFNRTVTYDLTLNNPRSLKNCARTTLRATYPGRKLHKVINWIKLPTAIREYILMECVNIDI